MSLCRLRRAQATQTHTGARSGSQNGRVTWLELQQHAAFPEQLTQVSSETIEVPLGRLDCIRYDVREDAEVATFWFSPEHPGMPVRYEAGGARTTVIEITTTA